MRQSPEEFNVLQRTDHSPIRRCHENSGTMASMSLEDDFKASVQRMNSASKAPSQADMLKLYGLFKQANEGDNNNQFMQTS